MDDQPPERFCSDCGDPWLPDTEPGQWTCSCGSTRRTTAVALTAEVKVEAFVEGRTKSDKKVASGRRAREGKFGDTRQASGEWAWRTYHVDRENDTYEEVVTLRDATEVLRDSGSLSEHLGHGDDR